MKKIWLTILFLITACSSVPVYKQSPEINTAAAAIKDSLDAARVDLAISYSDNLITLTTPPEKRIKIEPIYKNGKRVAIIPDKYKEDNVVVVGTEEWSNLIRIKEVVLQLANDKTNLNAQIESTKEELIKQQKLKEQLAEDKVNLTLKNNDLSNSLSKTRLYLIGLIILIAVYFYVKTQKLF